MKETAIVRKIQVNSYTRARFNSFNTGDILGWIILCHGAVTCVAGYLAASLASTY